MVLFYKSSVLCFAIRCKARSADVTKRLDFSYDVMPSNMRLSSNCYATRHVSLSLSTGRFAIIYLVLMRVHEVAALTPCRLLAKRVFVGFPVDFESVYYVHNSWGKEKLSRISVSCFYH